MKILYGAHPAVAIKKGGLYIQLMKTKSYMENLGFEIELFNPWKCPDAKSYDFFHLFGANFSTNIIATEIVGCGIPLIVTPVYFSKHSSFQLRHINRINTILFKLFKISTPHIYTEEILASANRILPNTEMEKNLIVKAFCIPERNVSVIHNAVEKRFAQASPDKFIDEFGLKDFILYVGYIGYGRKNTLYLIRALKSLDVRAVFIGPVVKTPYGKLCMKEISKNRNIKVLEALRHNSPLLESAYAACDTFVLPSLFETPGISALEAGLAGAKIVITKYGGTTEYFRGEAKYVEPKSVKSIRNGIIESLSKKKTASLKNYILKNYIWENIAKKIEKVYLSFK